MTRHDNDDIGSLFKAIGAKNNQFKEFSTQNNAVQAQERWPLFKTIDLEKRPPPPQLQSAEKQLWQKKASVPAPIAPATRKAGPSLGNKIAKGLHTLARPHTTSAPPTGAAAAAAAPAAFVAPQFGASLARQPESHAAEAVAAQRATFKLARPAASPPVAAEAAAAGSGLFASKKPASAKASVFGKAALAAAPPVAPPAAAISVPAAASGSAARSLFGKAEPNPITSPSAPARAAGNKKSLFGKAAAVTEASNSAAGAGTGIGAGSGNLSNLFARLEHPEPEPSKGLFGRKRKS